MEDGAEPRCAWGFASEGASAFQRLFSPRYANSISSPLLVLWGAAHAMHVLRSEREDEGEGEGKKRGRDRVGPVLDDLIRMHCISLKQTPPACMMLVVPFSTSENSDRSRLVARHEMEGSSSPSHGAGNPSLAPAANKTPERRSRQMDRLIRSLFLPPPPT